MSGLVTPESLSREGSPVPDYVDSATASPLNHMNTAAQYEVNTTSGPPSPPQHQGYPTGTTLIATSGVHVQNSQQLMSALQGKYLIATTGGGNSTVSGSLSSSFGSAQGKPGEVRQIQLATTGGGEAFTQGQVIVQTAADPATFTHTQVILPTHLTKYGGGYVTVNGEVKRVSSSGTLESTGGSGATVRAVSSSGGTVVVGVPTHTEYVEEVIEAEGVVMPAQHQYRTQEPLIKRQRTEHDHDDYAD